MYATDAELDWFHRSRDFRLAFCFSCSLFFFVFSFFEYIHYGTLVLISTYETQQSRTSSRKAQRALVFIFYGVNMFATRKVDSDVGIK